MRKAKAFPCSWTRNEFSPAAHLAAEGALDLQPSNLHASLPFCHHLPWNLYFLAQQTARCLFTPKPCAPWALSVHCSPGPLWALGHKTEDEVEVTPIRLWPEAQQGRPALSSHSQRSNKLSSNERRGRGRVQVLWEPLWRQEVVKARSRWMMSCRERGQHEQRPGGARDHSEPKGVKVCL